VARVPSRACLLLLPAELDRFILRDQATDLLRAQGVVAAEPPRIPFGALARLPAGLAATIARGQARRLIRRLGAPPAVVVMFHPVQYPLAQALVNLSPDCELWYSRWDRYEEAYDATPRMRRRLRELHAAAAERSSLTFAVSARLAELEREEGRQALLVPSAADSFPAPDPEQAVIAVSLGHHGWRTDWSLVRAVCERMPELVLLLVGAWHEQECADDPDFLACRALPNIVWLGSRSDEEAARLILCADVGIVPFKVEPFNDAGLPNRILKYARLGRRTVSPELEGVRTWERAVTTVPDAEAFVAALREQVGARLRPDLDLRAWALAQTARAQNLPLWERLEELGVDVRIGSAR
jgi:glycosyltransferase involved in cell wall biosynthesis